MTRCRSGLLLHSRRNIRFLTLTTAPGSSANINSSWAALWQRMKRRGWVDAYMKVREYTRAGRPHLHVVVVGDYMPQPLLRAWWSRIHGSSVLYVNDLRGAHRGSRGGRWFLSGPPYGPVSARDIPRYLSKYMAKDGAARYSWSWGWVAPGFAGAWERHRTRGFGGWSTWERGLWWLRLRGDLPSASYEGFREPRVRGPTLRVAGPLAGSTMQGYHPLQLAWSLAGVGSFYGP